jgi:hypothetical protein
VVKMHITLKELLDLFSIETVENRLTEMKEEDFISFNSNSQLDIEQYLTERKGNLALILNGVVS